MAKHPRLNDPRLVSREYKNLNRLKKRQLDQTAKVKGDNPTTLALQIIAQKQPGRVLDAGCGTGEFASRITVAEVVCIDISPAAVEAARARGLSAQVADIQNLPFKDNSFDVVSCNWVLYHLPNRKKGIAELHRVLRPEGFLMGIYNADDHLRELWQAIGDPWISHHDFNCATAIKELKTAFNKVDKQDVLAEAIWKNPADLQAYLSSFKEMAGSLAAPEGPYPFKATRHNCILIAQK